MKRLAAALAALMMLCLCACGPAESASETQAETPPPQEEHPQAVPEPEPTPEELAAQAVEELLSSMTREEKVGQLFFVRCPAESAVEDVSTYHLGGYVLFGRDFQDAAGADLTAEQVQETIAADQSAAKEDTGISLLIGVDEEGGRVARVSDKLGTTAFDPMASYGAAGDTEAVRQIGATIAQEISSFGFNVDFAPVADVVTNPDNTEIGDRSFSSDPAVAAQMVTAMVEGLQQNGVASCLKHFPGHGSTKADSHKGASVTERTLDELRETELLPFSSGIEAGATMVMVSHMSAPNVTGDETPCDLSPAVVTDLLRGELGYRGVVITDSHEMGAITEYYSPGEAAVKALSAGCDIILMPQDLKQAAQGVLDALADGTLTVERVDESVLRILILKLRMGICE